MVRYGPRGRRQALVPHLAHALRTAAALLTTFGSLCALSCLGPVPAGDGRSRGAPSKLSVRWTELWLRHAGRVVREAERRGQLRVADHVVQRCLVYMDLDLAYNVRAGGPRGLRMYFRFSVSDTAKRFFAGHREDVLEVARALLRAPDRYPPGRSYYASGGGMDAQLDDYMRKQSLLLVLLLRNKSSIPVIRDARRQAAETLEAVRSGEVRADGRLLRPMDVCMFEDLCDYAIDRLENDASVHWGRLPVAEDSGSMAAPGVDDLPVRILSGGP